MLSGPGALEYALQTGIPVVSFAEQIPDNIAGKWSQYHAHINDNTPESPTVSRNNLDAHADFLSRLQQENNDRIIYAASLTTAPKIPTSSPEPISPSAMVDGSLPELRCKPDSEKAARVVDRAKSEPPTWYHVRTHGTLPETPVIRAVNDAPLPSVSVMTMLDSFPMPPSDNPPSSAPVAIVTVPIILPTSNNPLSTPSLLPILSASSGNVMLEQHSTVSKTLTNGKRHHSDEGDDVNDTVGVIVIDKNGNLAAGSSSGGIALKMRGRVGPAAIPGVGTAVIPADPEDPEGTTVAVVVSGSGEWITSTCCAQMAAERLYHGMKKVGGGKLVPCDDEDVLHAFIEKEFTG
jgi:hypothetical protein